MSNYTFDLFAGGPREEPVVHGHGAQRGGAELVRGYFYILDLDFYNIIYFFRCYQKNFPFTFTSLQVRGGVQERDRHAADGVAGRAGHPAARTWR